MTVVPFDGEERWRREERTEQEGVKGSSYHTLECLHLLVGKRRGRHVT